MPDFEQEAMTFPNEVDQPTSLSMEDIVPVYNKPQVKTDDVFYASMLEGKDPVNDYLNAKQEIASTGKSTLVSMAEEKWQTENDAATKATLTQFLIDDTVDQSLKKTILTSYIASGYVPVSLRDKYLLKQTSVDMAITEADREAQDIYSANVSARDAVKKQQEAVNLVKEADITFSGVLKGTAAVAAGIALSIPAGLAGAFTLIKERDTEKANKILQYVQEFGYNPTDANSQRVIHALQEAMEFIDIPFKWMGDKTLDFTGSPGAATAVYTGSSVVGYIGGFQLGKAALKGKKHIDPNGPLGTTETANRGSAGALAVDALKDPSGRVAEAVRADKEAILGEYALAKIEDEFGDIRPDIREQLEKQDRLMQGIKEETEFNPYISPVSKIKAEREAYVAAVTESAGPKLLLSSSMLEGNIIESTVKNLKASLMFGRNSEFGYQTRLGAEYASEQLLQNTKHLPDPGKIEIVNKEGEFFLKWDFNREYNPWEHLAFGEDAISAHFVSPKLDITEFANGPVGDKIWPAYMRLKEWVPSGGQLAGWKEVKIENTFLTAQRALVLDTKHPLELSAILRKGEADETVYKFQDVQSFYPNLKKAEAEELYGAYVGYRRINDRLYELSENKYRKGLTNDGYQTLYNNIGISLGHVNKNVGDVSKVKQVWDLEKQIAIDKTPEMELVKMEHPIVNGIDSYEYAIVGKTHQYGPIKAGSLTRIPGYISRQYKEWFVLDKIPNKRNVNGVEIPAEKLRDYKGAIAMGKTKKEILALQERMQKEDPNNTYEWRREQKDIQDKIVHDSKVYESYIKETHQRGKALPALDRAADLEDVIVAQTNAIRSASRVTAWDEIMTAYKENWVKAYGDFSEYKFPTQINGIVSKDKMSPAESKRFLAAQKIYQQIEMQQFSTLQSDLIWKEGLHAIADVFEKVNIPASVLREVGEKGVIPLKMAKAMGAHLWLYLRFARMWLVQPQQMLELSTISPSFALSVSEVMPIFAGLLSRAHLMQKVAPVFNYAGRNTVKDYDAIINAMDSAGIMQAIDTNQMLHGVWKDSTQELSPKSHGMLVDAAKSMATGATKTALLPSRIGRAIGYDPSELLNQVTLWLFSKNRWSELNPGKDWNTPENIAQITALSGRIGHMASTRAGMYTWQEGMISAFTQFAAIPFKSFMQMLSSKDFTTGEKAKLAAARLFWYGKFGVPGGAAIYTILERNMPEEEREKIAPFAKGAANVIANASLHAMFDSGDEVTNVEWSKGTSIVPESIWFYDLAENLYKMSTGGTADKKFPFINATSSLFTTVRTVHDMFTVPMPPEAERDWSAVMYKAATFAGTLGDYAKTQVAEQVSKTGQSLGHAQTGGEVVARMFGIAPTGETVIWEAQRAKYDRDTEIKKEAKNIHERLIALREGFKTDGSTDSKQKLEEYIVGLQSFLQAVPESYKDDVIKQIFAADKKNFMSKKESLMQYLYMNYQRENDKHVTDMVNMFESSGDPEMKALVKELKEFSKRGQ